MNGNATGLKKLSPRMALLLFVAVNLLLGLLIAADYGESTDEAFERQRAGLALSIFSGSQEGDPVELYQEIGLKRYYGTGQTMLFALAEQRLGAKWGLPYLTVSHYLYFVSFQLAVVALYFLAAQLVGEWTAFAAAVLFGTQPLLFGHAFMNPKDIPLLAVFLATVAVGFAMVDRLLLTLGPANQAKFWQAVRERFKGFTAAPPRVFRWALGGIAGLMMLRLALPALAAPLVRVAYQAEEGSLLGRLFARLGAQAEMVPVEAYIAKAQTLLARGMNVGLAGGISLVILWFVIRLIPPMEGGWWKASLFSVKLLTRKQAAFILLAGAVWGFALSTRVVAFAAGGIVGLYLLLKLGGRAVTPGVIYVLAAALVCTLFWPYLWYFGASGFLEALLKFSDFSWGGIVLFEGQVFSRETLPEYYLFKLIPLQFTLPLVLLALGGMALGVVGAFRRKFDAVKIGLIFTWLFLPLIYTYTAGSVNYDNFRQYLFIMPPLFVFASLALDWLLAKIPWQAARLGLVVLVVLPGLVGLVRLHPYQYIYYNELAGGVSGAFREYALDYWLTSYKDAAEYIDAHVPEGSDILVWGGGRRIEPYVTHDYSFTSAARIDPAEFAQFEYVVVTSEYHLDLEYHLDAKTLFAVERAGVPLVLVKQYVP